MNTRFVFAVIAAATCLISAGLYVDEAIKSLREDKWDQAIKSEMTRNEALSEGPDVHKT